MTLADRRSMIRITLGAALVPVLATRPARAQVLAAGAPISPPRGAMIYRRRLVRGLPGGLTLTVERSFSVRFEELGRGYRLAGSQTSARVVAPSNLDAFARLEEQRVETGVFPLLLDAAGLIVDAPQAPRAEEVDRAVRLAEERLGLPPGGPYGDDEVAQVVGSFHEAGARMGSILPTDLFAPQEESRREEREVALPWGESGSVEMVFAASRDPSTGLMRDASRTVTTSIEGDIRESLEQWSLAEG